MRQYSGLELIGTTDVGAQLEKERKLGEAWAAHLRLRKWDHIATLTTAREAKPEGLLRAFRDGFVRALASRARQGVPYFVVVEAHISGAPHLHALVSGTAALSVREVSGCWLPGLARVARFRPHLRGEAYVVKMIARPHTIYEISRRLPPLRGSLTLDAAA